MIRRARVLYYTQIGYYFLDVKEPREQRLSYRAAYLRAFTGWKPDGAADNRCSQQPAWRRRPGRVGTSPPMPMPSDMPLWQSDAASLAAGLCADHLSPAWQMLLLGDGSPTRHLGLVTGGAVNVEVVAMTPVAASADGAPEPIREIAAPRLRREVWLVTASGQRLAHAVSWWASADAEAHLRDRSQPIWTSLTHRRTEFYRDLRGIALMPGDPSPRWRRHYLFWHQGQPLTLVQETFAGALERWLGPAARIDTSPSDCPGCRARWAAYGS